MGLAPRLPRRSSRGLRIALLLPALLGAAPRAVEALEPKPASGLVDEAQQRALVTVRLFLDLECPYCRQAWPVYRDAVKAQLRRGDEGGVRLVLHHLPLTRHPNALPAAHAAMAARKLGKELEFVDVLLKDPVPDAAAVARAAAAVGLDGSAMAKLVASKEIAAAVQQERQASLAFGIQATPAALVGGRGIAGTPPPEALARALQNASQQASKALQEAGASADVERMALMRHQPDFLPAFDALRAGRLSGDPRDEPPAVRGHLGERFRVLLREPEVAAGPVDSAVTAVLLLDPTTAWQVAQVRELLALQRKAPNLRVAVKLLPRPGGRSHKAGLETALLLTAAAQLQPGQVGKLLEAAVQRPTLQAAEIEAMALAQGWDTAALRKAAEQPPATVAVQAGYELAQRVQAQPGAMFLNGRRWWGQVADGGLPAALQTLTAEAERLVAAGTPRGQVHAALVQAGRYLQDGEIDLQPPEPLGDLSPLPRFGEVGVEVALFVDFASPHSRAAYYMLRRLVNSPDAPIRLHMASLTSTTAPCVSAAGASFATAARFGKGLELAEQLFGMRNPNDWQGIFAKAKALGLKPADFQRAIDAEATRAVSRATAALRDRLDFGDEPVIYIGGRLYTGPLDEARLERAVRFLRDARSSAAAPTSAGASVLAGADPSTPTTRAWTCL